jgi:hypothetical protein
MEHKDAIRLQAAERYLLGELSDTERDEFEQHFFACSICGQEVRAGAIFQENARALFREQPGRIFAQPGWWEWLSLRPATAWSLACLLLILLAGASYEALVAHSLKREIADLRTPQTYASFFLRGATRGAEQVIDLPAKSRFFGLSLDLPPGPMPENCLAELVSESGTSLFSVPLSKPSAPGEAANVLIPASSVNPGRRYTLIVRNSAAVEIASYHFLVRQN